MNTPDCPICGSPSRAVTSISFSWIKKAYARAYNIEVIPRDSSSPDYQFLKCTRCTLGHFSNALEGDGEFYGKLQQFPWYYRKNKWEYLHVAGLIQAGQSVLDVGCGIGEFSENLQNGVNFTGIEINSRAVQKAKELNRNVMAESLEQHADSKPGHYDAVCSFQVMEHVSDPLPMFKAMFSMVRPGGILVASVPNNDSYIGTRPNAILNMPPHHMLRWNTSSLRKLGEVLGADGSPSFDYEPMDREHKHDYVRYMALHMINAVSSESESIYNDSLNYKIRSVLIGKVMNCNAVVKLLPDGSYPIGHTVVAVFRKRR